MLRPAIAAELQWRRPRTSGPPSASERNAAKPAPRVDPSVRLTVLEGEGPRLSAAGEGTGRFRSVVVGGDTADDAVRAAQLPPAVTDRPLEQEPDDLFGPLPQETPPLAPPEAGELDLEMPPDAAAPPVPLNQNQQPLQPLQQDFRPPVDIRPRTLPGGATEPQQLPEPVLPQPTADRMETERKLAAEACEQGLEDIREKTIDKLNLKIAVSGEEGADFPFECTLDESARHEGRCWAQTTYLWKAAALCHKPLYFEDEQLERYGHSFTPCLQPFVSGAHFFTRLPVLPYCMGVEPPTECIYALGHYRPGSCAPYHCNPIPLSPRGALIQAGAVVGTAAVLP